jgi:hypothetical protein
MSPHASGAGSAPLADAASIALRLAQRAFAGLIDARDAGELGDARVRAAARRTLSALSADDRPRLVEWLALVIATHGAAAREALIARVGRTDRGVVAHVGRALRARVGTPTDATGASLAVGTSPARGAR